MLVMFLASLFGVPLFWLRQRWKNLRGKTRFARALIGRVVLIVGGVICLVFLLSALFTDFTADETRSVASSRASILVLAGEGIAACGYHLYRGWCTPSRSADISSPDRGAR